MQIRALVKKKKPAAVAHCVTVGKVYMPGNARITLTLRRVRANFVAVEMQ
jgi:hypothetical protein